MMGLAVIIVVGLVIFVGDTDRRQDLDLLAAQFEAAPTSEHLRDLLNFPADGEYSYYQMALTGAAFNNHPDIFRVIYEDPHTKRERGAIDRIRSSGAGVFEYHPELKPPRFDMRLIEQTWLIQKKPNKSEIATPRKPSD